MTEANRWVWPAGHRGQLAPDDTVGVLCQDKITAARCFAYGLGRARRTILLDPRDGPGRIRQQAERAGARWLLTDAGMAGRVDSELLSRTIVVAARAVGSTAVRARELAPAFRQTDEHHEYAIFTSGSTGEPTMVVQTLAAATALAEGYVDAVGIDASDTVAVWGSGGHDAFVLDIMSSLVTGCRLSFVDPAAPRFTTDLAGWLRARGISVWHSVPTVWRALAGRSSGAAELPLRTVVLGGEEVLPRDVRLSRERCPRARMYSLYGQTEISVIAGAVLDDEEQCGLLGADITGVETGLLRSGAVDRAPLDGTGGELVVHSVWHATASSDGSGSGSGSGAPLGDGWWPTGDLVRREGAGWRFVGRSDDVVKVHGDRVGLSEVERLVCEATGARDALAYVVDAGGGQVALGVLLDAAGHWTVPSLNAAVRSRMPASLLVRQLVLGPVAPPVGRTGKADRAHLRRALRLGDRSSVEPRARGSS